MRNITKRLLIMFTVILVCLTVCIGAAACPVDIPYLEVGEERYPYEGSVVDGYFEADYYKASNECWISEVDKSISGDVVIPATIGGYKVTKINGGVFADCINIEKLTIPDGVKEIGRRAFRNCTGLKSVTFPGSLTKIDEHAFRNCTSLENITFPDSSKATIGYMAFASCTALKSIAIPCVIGESAFSDCTKLENITVSGNSIGKRAFANCKNLKNVTISDSVNLINIYAFENCSGLENVTIPKSVAFIDYGAFFGCTALQSITVDENNTNYSNDIYGVLFNKDKTTLIQYPVANTATSYEIPDGVTTIGCYAFKNSSNLTEIKLPDNVTTIGCSVAKHLANNCTSLKNIVVDEKNTAFSSDENGVLFDKNKTTLMMYPAGRTSTSYIVPETVTTIYSNAFTDCESLEDIYYLGNKDKYIEPGNSTVHYCEKVETSTTCNVAGNIKYVCKECSASVVVKTTPSMGHSFTDYVKDNNATCISDGTKTAKCDRCSATKTVADTGSVLGHNMGGYIVVKKPTATAEGEERSSCSRCDYYVSRTLPLIPNIYNLGEESYRFPNFADSYSSGHCFGMSMTSSAYYLGLLDKSIIGGDVNSSIYSFSQTDTVNKPICHYQKIQGYVALGSMVAGGTNYKDDKRTNISSDWNEVVNYVKNHDYDDKGTLQIAFRGYQNNYGRLSYGGHAINFLRYAEVDGQPRIYVYDNNFPNIETYFYKDSNGDIKQGPSPYETFNHSIFCIAIRSVPVYFEKASEFDSTLVFYAQDGQIEVEGVTPYYMDTDGKTQMVMYELEERQKDVVITPLVDNATFTYCDSAYGFGAVADDTYGVFTLGTNDDLGGTSGAGFEIHNSPDNCDCNCHAGGIKAFFFKIINFFQKLFGINKVCACGVKH